MEISSITYKFETFEALQRALEVLKANTIDYTGYGIRYLPNGEVDYYYIADYFHFIGSSPKFDIRDILTAERIPFEMVSK